MSFSDLKRLLRKKGSKVNITFAITFIGIIIFIGGISIWKEIYTLSSFSFQWAFEWPFTITPTALISDAIFAYGVALLATMGADFTLESSDSENSDVSAKKNEGEKTLRLTGFFVGAVAVLLLVWGSTSSESVPAQSVIATILIWVLWFYMNVGKDKFVDVVSPETAIGGAEVTVDVLNTGGGTK